MTYILAIDQGTTNSRAILFNERGEPEAQHEIALKQNFPHSAWVEQDPEEMFENSLLCCQEVLKKAKRDAKQIAALGISNQRETTIIWDRLTGLPIYPAIVWQDRRTAELCKTLASHPIAAKIQEKTGLLLDPYFSATKVMWLLDNVPQARQRAERGELLFGTVDSYLIWKLSGGKSHVTDASNASRTLLFNLKTQSWDPEILKALNIPAQLLPQVLDNAAHFGDLDARLLGASIPITGVAGDQQAAAIGQACFHPGSVKATYGTGAFLLLNTGAQLVQSPKRLLSTVLYRLNNEVHYGLEGSIFCAGTTVKWLRDSLGIIQTASETQNLSEQVKSTEGVYFIPAFTGMGAPYWDPEARAAIVGLTRNSGRAHIVRAALESVAYQTRDLIEAMLIDESVKIARLRVDGGMATNPWLMQFLSDILNIQIEKPHNVETTALGAAYLAGLYTGIFPSLDSIALQSKIQMVYSPQMPESQRVDLYRGWKQAVEQVLDK